MGDSAIVNLEVEQALLAAILMNNRLWEPIAGTLRPSDFADAVHGRIWSALSQMIQKGEIANVLTLRNLAQSDGALVDNAGRPLGGKYLASLANAVVSLIGIPDYARLIRDLAERRRIVRVAEEAAAAARNVRLDETAGQIAMRFAMDLQTEGVDADDFQSLADVAEKVTHDLIEPLPCSSTGEPELDRMLGGGFFAGKLYGFKADHKAGKTLLLGTFSYNQHKMGIPHLYQCLEMSPEEITQRYLGRATQTNALRFIDPETRDQQWFIEKVAAAALKMVQPAGCLFMSKPRAHLDDIKTAIVRAAMRHKIRGVYLDYLQLVSGQQRGQSMAEFWDQVTGTLAELAKMLGIWIVVNIQNNRDGLVRGGDGIMKAADMVLNLHRIAGEDGKKTNFGWLDMEASRYTPYTTLGDEDVPGLELNSKHGPYFEIIPQEHHHEARDPSEPQAAAPR